MGSHSAGSRRSSALVVAGLLGILAGISGPDTAALGRLKAPFVDSGQSLGSVYSFGVAPGDLDGDGDLDAFIGHYANQEPERVFLNDGSGTFTDSGQSLGAGYTLDVDLVDVDLDGDLDCVVANQWSYSVLYVNDGTGTFTESPNRLRDCQGWALGDWDSDGDSDAFAVRREAPLANEVWFNHGGQFVLPTADTVPATIAQGAMDDVLRITLEHNGISSDPPIELASLELLFEESPGDPLSTTEANGLSENLHVYLDDGSTVFQSGSDTLVATSNALALAAGVQSISFPDGDAGTRVDYGTSKTYFVVTELTANAALHTPNQFRVTHISESSSSAEDRGYDTLPRMEYSPNTSSSIVTVPLALEVAGELLVDLRGEDPSAGTATWVNHGTLGDFGVWGDPTTGVYQAVHAVYFDGAGDGYVGPLSVPTIEGGSDRTIEVWVNNPSIPDEETLVSWSNRGGPLSTNMSFNYGTNPYFGAVGHWGLYNGDMGWGTGNNSIGNPVTPAVPVADRWHHLVYTYDGATASLYVDGVFLDSEIPNPTVNTHAGYSINVALQRAGASFVLDGSLWIAAVRIHSEALSTTQVLHNYNQRLPDTEPPDSHVEGLAAVVGTAVFDVPYIAIDPLSGVKHVELFYRKDGGAWTQYGTTYTISPISFDSSATGGDGFYEFYTIATDNLDLVEAAPAGPDDQTWVNTSFAGTRVYVDQDATTGAQTGVDWANAVLRIDTGIALAEAFGASEVWVAEGTYEESIDLVSNVAVYGGFDATETLLSQRDIAGNPTIIDGSTADGGGPADHVVVIDGVSGARIDGFTITGGSANGVSPDNCGGGVYCANADNSNTIAYCTITGNAADLNGGGIAFRYGSSPAVTSCTISSNTTQHAGAGVLVFEASTPVIDDCLFLNNSATDLGGGVMCEADGSPTINGCTFVGNSTNGWGGGVCVWDDCAPVVTDCSFIGNYAGYRGGAIGCVRCSAQIVDCNAMDNTARENGGAFAFGGTVAIVDTCEITSNTTIDWSGGGIHCDNSTATIANCAINDNYTSFSGGGILCWQSTATLTLCTISGNTAYSDDGGGVECIAASSVTLTLCTINNNTAGWGGGIHASASPDTSLAVHSCHLSGNTARLGGGAIECFNFSPEIIDCVITGNVNTGTDGGGGVRFNRCFGEITSCTISGNSSQGSGGGVRCVGGGGPVITDCMISDNRSNNWGGGINTGDAAVQMIRCTVFNNTAAGSGGGIRTLNSPAVFTDCMISSNTAARAGGAILGGETPTLIDCTISSNSATGATAGGVFCDASAPTITDCLIVGNSAAWRGGGMYCGTGSTLTMSGCTIAGNSSGDWGGGLFLWTDSSGVVTNCTLTGNFSGSRGAGIGCAGALSPQFSHCDVVDNTAQNSGGGIALDNTVATIDACTINGNTAVDWDGGGIHCANSTATIVGCTINDNYTTHGGGGLICWRTSATISQCTINNNTANASNGGGVECYNNTHVVISDCTIDGNSAVYGGGVHGADLTTQLTVRGCHMSGNTARLAGGAIECYNFSPRIIDCVITGNSSPGTGGGVRYNRCAGEITGCVISGNRASSGNGGGISNNESVTTIVDSIISGNHAATWGGAMDSVWSTPTLTNCIVTGNFADTGGGAGLACGGTFMRITNCTISDNDTPGGDGGGGFICGWGSSAVITNTVFARNNAQALAEQTANSDVTTWNCLFHDNPDGDYRDEGAAVYTGANDINTSVPEATNNVDGDPMFLMGATGSWTEAPVFDPATSRTLLGDSAASFTSGALAGRLVNPNASQHQQALIADNTTTRIVVLGDVTGFVASGDPYELIDYHLRYGSGAIDLGTDAGAPVVDIEGNARPVDVAGLGADGTGTEFDIGAYEAQIPAVPAPTMASEPAVTAGTQNTVYWSVGAGTRACTIECDDASDFASPVDSVLVMLPTMDHTFTGLTDGQTYWYRARAHDVASFPSAWSAPVSSTQDASGPSVVSSVRADASPTSVGMVNFTVTFDEDVTGADTGDFALTVTGSIAGASISGISGSGTVYTVSVDTGSGDGTVRLDVIDDDSIVDPVANPLGGAGSGNGDYNGGEIYTIDKTPPDSRATGPSGTIQQVDPIIPITFEATDAGSGVRAVRLFYRRNGLGGFQQYAADFTASPISFDTSGTGGDGQYEFYVVAIDNVGNLEETPSRPDILLNYNITTSVHGWNLYR